MVVHCNCRSRLFWIYASPVGSALDVATWLETTRELRKLGWKVTLLAEGPAGQHSCQGVEVTCLPKPQVYFLGMFLFHLRVLHYLMQRWGSVDAILFHQISALWILPLRLVRVLLGQKRPLLVMDTRDLVAVEGTLRSRLRLAFFRVMHWLANHLADGQTAITPRMVQLVRIPPERLWGIWPSGVDLDRFRPAQEGRTWPMDEEPVQLMYIGKLDAERNLLPLAQAVAKAKEQGLGLVLWLVGEGPQRPELERFALQTGGAVHIQSAVPHPQIPELLRKAHVGVTSLPAPDDRKFAASSPIKLFEYMAAGLPVLATDNVCHSDVVGSGGYAFWIRDLGEHGLVDVLQQIWHNRGALQQMGYEAAVAAQAWTWQEAGKKLDTALQHGLLSGGAGAPQ